MHIDTYGQKSAPKVVLLHGSGAPPASLRALADALSATHHVLVPHFPGYGEEKARADVPFEQAMNELVEQLDMREIYSLTAIGHSLGFYRATRLLELCPLRLERLIGLGGVSSFPEQAREAYGVVEQQIRSGELTVDGLLGRWFSPDYVSAHPEVRGEVASWWEACAIDAVCRELFVPMDNGLHDHLLSEARVPVHLIHGTVDAAVPFEHGQQIARLGDHIELSEVEGCGHTPHMEYPERTLATLHDALRG